MIPLVFRKEGVEKYPSLVNINMQGMECKKYCPKYILGE